MHIRSCQLPCLKCHELKRVYSSFYILGNGRNKYKKMNSPGEFPSVLRRMAKLTSIAVRIGFYLLKILLLQGMDVDLALSITNQQPGQSSWFQGRVQVPALCQALSPSCKRFPGWALELRQATQPWQLIPVFTLENQVGYKGDNPAVNLLQSLLSSPGISLYSPSKLTQRCSFKIELNWTSIFCLRSNKC